MAGGYCEVVPYGAPIGAGDGDGIRMDAAAGPDVCSYAGCDAYDGW